MPRSPKCSLHFIFQDVRKCNHVADVSSFAARADISNNACAAYDKTRLSPKVAPVLEFRFLSILMMNEINNEVTALYYLNSVQTFAREIQNQLAHTFNLMLRISCRPLIN